MSELVKDVKRVDNSTIVLATGEITFEKSPEFHETLIDICAQKPANLIINLSEVTYIDSSGVGTLAEIFRRVHGNGGRMALVGMNKMVRSVFEITRLDQVFPIYDTEEQALNS